MRPMPAHLVLCALGLAAAAALAQETEPVPAEEVRAKIAALDLDAAKPLVERFKAAAKTSEAKAQAKALERDLAIARKIEPIATKQVPKLVAENKLREAYALLWSAAGQFPGAVALPGLKARVKEARDRAHLVIDDFDASPIPPGKEHPGGDGKGATKMVGNVAVGSSRVALVEDATGGHALRWAWDALDPEEFAVVSWRFAEIDASTFDYATLRVRAVRLPAKPLHVQLISPGSGNDRGKLLAPISAGAGWRELRVPLGAYDRKGSFDPKKVTAITLSCFSPGCELIIDEVLLARKAAK